jgi:hypothetical protein
MKPNLNNFELVNLFPQAVARSNIGREFNDEEYDCINENSKNVQGNFRGVVAQSADSFILDDKRMSSIRQHCLHSVERYWEEVLDVKRDNTYPIITQSWLNYTNKFENMWTHIHPNSHLSGVFYISCDKDHIEFLNPHLAQISICPDSGFNEHNSSNSLFEVVNGECLIFPSHLRHHVPMSMGDHTRISIAFNTFPQGVIGSEEDFTYLDIEVKK